MQVNVTNVHQFQNEGYTIVKNFFDDREVDRMRLEIDTLRKKNLFKNVSTLGDGETHSYQSQNLQLIPASNHSLLLKALPFSRKVRESVVALIGSEALVRHLDQIFLKPRKTGKGTNWHQDNYYFRLPSAVQGTAMWIAIDDANIKNGTMRLVPKKYEEILPHGRDFNSDHHKYCQIDENQAIFIEAPAGSAVFFHYMLPHATGDNQSDVDRCGLAYHFVNLHRMNISLDQLAIHDFGNYARPYLSGENYTKGVTEYGENMESLWELALVDRI